MLGASRILFGLAVESHAPRIFLRTNRYGVPYLAVSSIGIFMVLGYMTLSQSAATVFNWFQDLVSAATFVHWIIICIVYLRFFYACKRQNIDRAELPWKSPLQPYGTWAALITFTVLLLTSGYTVFINGQ
jgi:amino acid transporter